MGNNQNVEQDHKEIQQNEGDTHICMISHVNLSKSVAKNVLMLP